MSATAGLSIAANAFAPIGLADVAFRVGRDVIELILKIRNAPVALNSLVHALRSLENAIAETRAYLVDFADSDFVYEDEATIPDLTFILQSCQSEFDRLRSVIHSSKPDSADTWLLTWRKRTAFALNEKEIDRCHQRLDRLTCALNTTLSASKGRNQVLLRNQLSLVRSDNRHANDKLFQRIARSDSVIVDALDSHSQKLDQIHETVMRMASITIKETSDNTIELFGTNSEDLLLPLLLVKSQLSKIIPILSRGGKTKLSSSELKWLQDELNCMVSDASTGSCRSFSTSSPPRYSSIASFDRLGQVNMAGRGEKPAILSDSSDPDVAKSDVSTQHKSQETHSFDTPVGTLCLKYDRDPAHTTLNSPSEKTTTIRFAFIPRLEVQDIGFISLITRQENNMPISRQLRTYRVLRRRTDVMNLIREDDVRSLQAALSRREITPFDCNKYGEPLALLALRANSKRVFNLLLNEGGCVQAYFGSASPLQKLWRDVDFSDFDAWCELLPKAIDAGLELPSRTYIQGRQGSMQAKLVVQFLKSTSGLDALLDFWSEGGRSLSPLCCGCMDCDDPCRGRYDMMRLLTTYGADFNVPNYFGQNPWHKLCRYMHGDLAEDHSRQYERLTIELLLKVGCRLNTVDHSGRTPIDYIDWKKWNFWGETPFFLVCLKSLGYHLLQVPRIHPIETGLIIVPDDSDVLPVRNGSLERHAREKAAKYTHWWKLRVHKGRIAKSVQTAHSRWHTQDDRPSSCTPRVIMKQDVVASLMRDIELCHSMPIAVARDRKGAVYDD